MQQQKETRYQFWTIKDITDVITEKNLDVFIEDFRQYLQLGLETKKLNSNLANTPFAEQGIESIETDRESFRWIDDGEAGLKEATIQLKTTFKKPESKGPVKIKVKYEDESKESN